MSQFSKVLLAIVKVNIIVQSVLDCRPGLSGSTDKLPTISTKFKFNVLVIMKIVRTQA